METVSGTAFGESRQFYDFDPQILRLPCVAKVAKCQDTFLLVRNCERLAKQSLQVCLLRKWEIWACQVFGFQKDKRTDSVTSQSRLTCTFPCVDKQPLSRRGRKNLRWTPPVLQGNPQLCLAVFGCHSIGLPMQDRPVQDLPVQDLPEQDLTGDSDVVHPFPTSLSSISVSDCRFAVSCVVVFERKVVNHHLTWMRRRETKNKPVCHSKISSPLHCSSSSDTHDVRLCSLLLLASSLSNWEFPDWHSWSTVNDSNTSTTVSVPGHPCDSRFPPNTHLRISSL